MLDDNTTEAKPDPQIHFNGNTYDLVKIRDFTLDEHMVLWDYAKMSADRVSELDDVHPGVLAATLYVSVARAGDPSLPPKRLKAAIGKLTQEELLEVLADMIDDEDEEVGDESVPPLSEPAPEQEPAPQPDLLSNGSGLGSEPTGATVLAVIEGSGSGPSASPPTAASESAISATATDRAAG